MDRVVRREELLRPLREFWSALAAVQSVETPPASLVRPRLALGLIASTSVKAPIDVPGFASAAMDGYAVRAVDLELRSDGAYGPLRVVGTSFAGGDLGQLEEGCALKIMTGSRIPSGADCVVPWENTDIGEHQVTVTALTSPGQHIRPPNHDIASGQLLLPEQGVITPARIAALVASGVEAVRAFPKPRVAILVTGDELVEGGSRPTPGQRTDSNGPFLEAYVEANGGVVSAIRRVNDSLKATLSNLNQIRTIADAVITTGGVSVGEHDWIRTAIEEIGTVEFWRVAMRPGKPLLFGHLDSLPVLALPGNPVSTIMCCYLFLGPMLRKLRGLTSEPTMPAAEAMAAFRSPADRVSLVPVQVAHGRLLPLRRRHPGLGDLTGADALAVLPAGGASIGDMLPYVTLNLP